MVRWRQSCLHFKRSHMCCLSLLSRCDFYCTKIEIFVIISIQKKPLSAGWQTEATLRNYLNLSELVENC